MKINCLGRLVCLFLFFGYAAGVRADPVGGQVVAGRATITSPAGGVVNINQLTGRVIINWNSFSIAPGEVTRFIQPSATSAALNRVISDNPSLIYGSLQANGHVYLINQSGVLVGPGGQVNTAGFVASALDVNNASFLSGGNLIFSGNSTAGVNNQGSIQALGGDVFLIANTVGNSGSIKAAQGTVGLAAGSSVQLLQSGQERISVLAGNSSAPQAATGVNNAGTIEATTAELKAAGGNIYALAINNGGVIRATSLVNENGSIMLKSDGGNIANSGTLSANNADGSGGSITVDGGHNAANASTVINTGTIEARGDAPGSIGGSVKILGDHVGLFGSAVVDVSGDGDGGTALVGGGLHGRDPGVQNAEMTIVSPDASIKADAGTAGNGGSVVVWADDSTRYYGNISARGGSQGGNGGFAEVSGKDSLDFSGTVDLRAPHGAVGDLLLDPKNITVASGGTNTLAGNVNFTDNPGASVTFTPGSLVTALGSADVTLQANNNIVFNNNVDASAQPTINNLTLQAGNSITLNNSTITLTSAGNHPGGVFTATFNDGGATAADRDAGTAAFTMNGTSAINASGGITIQSGNFAGTPGDVTLTSLSTTPNNIAQTSGNIVVMNNAVAGQNISVSGTLATDGVSASGGSTAGQSAGSIQLTASGSVSLVGVGSTLSAAGGSGHGGQAGGDGGSISLTTGTTLSIAGTIDTSGGVGAPVGGPGSVTLDNTGSATGAGLIATGTLNLNGAGNVGTVGTPLSTTITALALNKTGGDSFVSDTGALAVQGSTTGNLNVTAAGDITQGASLVVGATANFNAGAANNITLNNAANDFATAQFTGNNVSVHDVNAIDLGGSTIHGNLTVNAGGNITESGALLVNQAGKTAAFTTTGVGADILLGSGANNFTAVTVAASGGGSILDLSLRNVSPAAAVPALPATIAGNLSLIFNNAAIALPGITVGGNLSVTAGGNITQTGPLVNNTPGDVASFSAGAHNITLNNAGNDFTTAQFTGNNVSVTDVNGIDMGTSTIAGTLTVNAGGAIMENGGPMTNGGTATFNAGVNDITLNNPANNFGTVQFTGNNVSVQDANGIDIGASTIGGNLTVTAGGNITQSGAVTDNGVGAIASFNAGANNITLNNAGNDFTTVQLAGNNVSVTDVNGIDMGASTIGGNLTVNAAGNITENTGAIVMTGGAGKTAAFNAGAANDITLNNAANDFATAAFTGNNVSVQDVNAIDLGASTIGGNLTVNAGGNITESGALLVAGGTATAAFTTTGANAEILLGAANNFTAVTIGASGGGSILDLTLRNISAAATLPALPASIGGNLNLTFDNAAIALPGITVGGNLSVTAGGDITQTGVLVDNTPGKTASFDAGAHDITLNNANNDFATVQLTGNNVSLTDVNGIDMGASTIGGNLAVIAGGNITQSGAVTDNGVGAIASFNAGANNIALNNAGNDFTTMQLAGNNVSVTDANGIDLGASTIGGNLTVAAGGNVTQSGVVTDNGAGAIASFNAGANNITLNNAGNDFTTVQLTGNNVSVTDANGIDLGASTIGGNLAVNAAGNITENTGAIAMTGGAGKTASFNAGAANDITLNNAANDFATAAFTGNNVSVVDANAIDLGASTAVGNLSVTALNGGVTESGAINANGMSIAATGGSVNLNGANQVNNLSGVVNGAGNGFSFSDLNPLTVTSVNGVNGIRTANGAVTLTANAMNIAQSVNSGTARTILQPLTAGENIDLGTKTAGELGLTAADLGQVSSSVLQVGNASAGAITVSAPVAPGSATLALLSSGAVSEGAGAAITENGLRISAGGPVTLNGANQVGNVSAAVSGAGNAFSLADVNPLTVASVDGVNGVSTANGAITLTANAMTLAQAVNSGTARTILQPLAAGENIDLGTKTAGELGLTAADLNEVSASVLQVGNAGAGGITVSAAIAPGVSTLALVNNSSVNESAGGTITENSLRISAAGPVTLDGNNHVGNAAGVSSGPGNGFSFVDASQLTVASVDGVNGISTVNGDVTLRADTMNISQAVNAGTGRTTLEELTAGRSIDLGTKTPGELGLTSADLNQVTAGVLQVGDGAAGAITVSGAIAPIGASVLSLVNNNTVNEGGGTITENSLRVSAAGPVTLDGNNHVNNVAGVTSAPGGTFSITDANPLTVATVDGVNGISTANAAITLTADAMNINQAVNSGTAQTTLQPLTAGEDINLGAKIPGELGLTSAEFSRITAGVYQIGNANAGNITLYSSVPNDTITLGNINTETTTAGTRLDLRTDGSVMDTGAPSGLVAETVVVPNLSIDAPHGNVLLDGSINNDVNFLASLSTTPIHFIDANSLKVSSDVTWDVVGIIPTSTFVLGNHGGLAISTLSVQLAGIAYVDIPVLTLNTANFTAVMGRDPRNLLPPGSIGTLGLTVPYAEEGNGEVPRRIEDRTKWVTGRMVVSGSTAAPQSPKQ